MTTRCKLMGAAGFAADPEFFGTLAACRDRGADLATIRALRTGLQVVILNRKRDMLSSEAWAPMHPYLREVEWSDFVATPFDLQGTGTGVINCYMATNGLPDDEVKAFFRSMAALAALAIDHHQLIRRDREQARLDERARIARDLHDSVLQHLFAIGMQSKALERQAVELGRSGEAILAMAREFHETSVSARSELRSIIESARVTSLDESGIAASSGTRRRSLAK
ncbi:GAF domain-containing sensor histidine kinase [Microbacterium elymi]|uniref:GAF domain-containing sensor histidine kinase n=1 Tax=Microbacterium elymi TaxID=2909587 RepID=UPI0025B6F2FE|nr:histidine kinase [Microbacterium elymi]